MIKTFKQYNENIIDYLKPKSKDEIIKNIKIYIKKYYLEKGYIVLPHSEYIWIGKDENNNTKLITSLHIEGVRVLLYNKNMIKKDSYIIPYEVLSTDIIDNITSALRYIKKPINEGITNILKGKSKDDILKTISKIDISNDIFYVIKKYTEVYPQEVEFFVEFINNYPIKSYLYDDIYNYFYNGYNVFSSIKQYKNILDDKDKVEDLISVLDARLNSLDDDNDLLPNFDIIISFIKDLLKTSWATKIIYESVKDLLKGKSDEEIEKTLKELNILEKVKKVKSYNLNDKYMPSDKEIQKALEDNWRNVNLKNVIYIDDKILLDVSLKTLKLAHLVIKYKLPENFFPQEYIDVKNKTILNIKKYYDKLRKLLINKNINNENKFYLHSDLKQDELFLRNNEEGDEEGITEHIIYVLYPEQVGVDLILYDIDESKSYKLYYEDLNLFILKKIDDILTNVFYNFNQQGQTKEDQKEINENVKNLLKGKSDEEIEKALKELDILEKVEKVKSYNLDDKYMPSDEEVKNYLDNLDKTDIEKVQLIFKYELSEKFLPKNYELYKKRYIKNIKKFFKKLYDNQIKYNIGQSEDYYKPPNIDNFYFNIDDLNIKNIYSYRLSYKYDMHYINRICYNNISTSVIDEEDMDDDNIDDNIDSYETIPYENLNIFDLKEIYLLLKTFINKNIVKQFIYF